MRTTGHNANTPSTPKTGLFAMLRGLLRAKGSGAPKIALGFVLAVLATMLGVLAFTVAPALAAAPEAPETTGSKSVTATTAVLEGVLNPHAAVATKAGWYFAYTTEPVCMPSLTSPLEGEEEVKAKPEHVEVTGLEPNKEYTFCMVATSEEGAQATPSATDLKFKTQPAPPKIDSEGTSAVDSTAATLEAQVNPNNQETTYEFEYATEAAGEVLKGKVTHLLSAVALKGYGDQLASAEAGTAHALTPGTTYYYRVVAENAQSEAEHKPAEGGVQSFTTVPTPTTDPANPVTATTATLNGHFTLTEPTTTQYSFSYSRGSECQGGEPVTTASTEAGAGTTEAKETANITELAPDTEYTACLTTSNQFGSQTAAPVHFTTLIRESATEVTATSAELHAEINPDGAPTTYHFEYGTSSSYDQSTPEATLFGEDEAPHTGSAAIQELAPATEYHYRVITHNTITNVTTTGPDATFETQATGGEFKLPDNRAWEMVSPVNKHGATIRPVGFSEGAVDQAAENGAAFTYPANDTLTAGPEGNPTPVDAQALSTRTSLGWTTRDIAAPHETAIYHPPGNQYPEYLQFSPSLSGGIINRRFLDAYEEVPLSPEASEPTIYLREPLSASGTGAYLPLVNDHNVIPGAHYGLVKYIGASPDLAHVVVHDKGEELTAGGGKSEQSLYEWSAGHISYIGNGYLGDGNEDVRGAISDDGTRVFFQSNNDGSDGHLYARLTPESRTVQLDVVQGGSGTGEEGHLRFQYATPDGSKVFFTDDQRLTPDSTAETAEFVNEAKPELYEYDFAKPEGHQLTDLTPNPTGTSSTNVKGEAEFSENGEYVYFYASGTLDGAPEGECARNGSCNLYVSHVVPGAAPAPKLLATLPQADYPDWTGAEESFNQAHLGHVTSAASPNGVFFTFMSSVPLTGYDNRDAASAHPDEEVYLYNALAGRLVCVSCDPTGARPHGQEDRPQHEGLLVDGGGIWVNWRQGVDPWLAGLIPGWDNLEGNGTARYRSRYLSNEGRLFFDAADALVPQDTNGTFDVYEYEPEGVGPAAARCAPGIAGGSDLYAPAEKGCVGLISSGESPEESAFLDASGKGGPGSNEEEGEDVFFLTSSQLSKQDVDTSLDVYDAHVCSTAAPCPPSAATSPPCTTTDSCRVAPAAQPSIYGAPASATFSGQGNPASTPAVVKKVTKKAVKCKHGYVKKKNRCVKNKKAKRAGHNRRTKS